MCDILYSMASIEPFLIILFVNRLVPKSESGWR